MVEQSYRMDLRDSDRLTFYVGEIVLRFHAVFEIFKMAGVLYGSEVDIMFERRRRSWHTEMQKSFQGRPEKLRELELLNNRIIKAKDIRDALVHGDPRQDFDKEMVLFTMNNPEQRFRQRALAYYLKKAVFYKQPRPRKIAKSQSMGDRIEFTYRLHEIGEIAEDMQNLFFDVMTLNVHAARAVGRMSDPVNDKAS